MDTVAELAGIKKRVFLNQIGRIRTEVNKSVTRHTDREWNVIMKMIMELEENHLKNQTLLYGAIKDSAKLRKAMDEDVAVQDLLFSLKLDLRIKIDDGQLVKSTIPDAPNLSDIQKILMKLDVIANGILRIQKVLECDDEHAHQLDEEFKSETK